MKLSLRHFRNHDSLDLEFPETGLVRIDGRSGTGKSSIFQAIHYCLHGKGRNITTWNEKSSKVSFEGFGLNIERTKNPNFLSCNGVNTVTAQDEIERILGMNALEFEISSYISQGQRSSLINLSPSEQLTLINALSFRDKNPEEHKERIKEFIKATDKELDAQNFELKNLQTQIDGTKNVISSLEGVLSESSGSIEELEAKKALIEREIAEKTKENKELIAKLKAATAEQENPARKQFDAATEFMKTAVSKIEELEHEARRPENREIVQDKAEINAKINTLNQEVLELNRKNAKLKMMEKNAVDSDALSSILIKSCEEISSIVDFSFHSESEEIGEKLLRIKLAAEKGLSAADSMKLAMDSSARSALKEEIAAISARMMEIYKTIEEISKENDKITQHNARVALLSEQLKELKSKKSRAEGVIGSNFGMRTLNELEAEIAEIRARGRELLPTIRTLESELTNVDSQIQKCAEQARTQEKIKQAEEKLKNETKIFQELQQKLKATEKLFADAQKLEALWAKAALDVIESTISEINMRAAYWLDLLLEGKVSAELKTTKKVKSKDQTIDSINLQVMFKGQILEKISEELSGGQYSRVVLAYQLAIGDLYNSPILMLDEALKGCDAQTVEVCIEALKTAAARKLLVMVEHHVSDHEFDHVIKLEDY